MHLWNDTVLWQVVQPIDCRLIIGFISKDKHSWAKHTNSSSNWSM